MPKIPIFNLAGNGLLLSTHNQKTISKEYSCMSSVSSGRAEKRRRFLAGAGFFAIVVLITLGVFASNGWFPRTDAFSGKRTGWFGRSVSSPHVIKGSATDQSGWFASAPPSPTPQLSKELIYAGSRLLAVEDANASAAPPSDLAVWRSSTGQWWVLGGPGSSGVVFGWGQAGDTPIPGDFDGDGKTDFSVFRPGTGTCPCAVTWYIIHSSTGAWSVFQYAINGDLPAQADYDGDGRTDPAVFRPSNSTWYIQGSSAGYYHQSFGSAGDKPAPADYDGDGRADLGVFRPSTNTFYSYGSAMPGMNPAATGLPSGSYDWETVSSDYDGDGKADYAAYDTLTANWHIRPSSGAMSSLGTPSSTSSGGFGSFQWGAAADRAVPNDYDGDGKTDLAVWRNSNGHWHIRQSATANSLRQVGWGQSGDIPVPAFYRR